MGRRRRILASGGVLASAITIAVVAAGGGGGSPPGTANLWVDTNGGTCTRQASPAAYSDAAACSSLNAAYQAASPGDTAEIVAGTYGSQTIAWKAGATGPAVTLRAASGATVNLTGGLSVRSSYVTIEGLSAATSLTVQNTSANLSTIPRYVTIDGSPGTFTVTGGYGGSVGYMRGVSDVTLRKVDICCSNNDSMFLMDEGANYGGLTNITFDQSVFHDAHKDSGNPAHTECVYAQGIVGFTVTRSRFYRCVAIDLFLTWNDQDEKLRDVWIENNVFEPPMAAGNTCCSSYAIQQVNGAGLPGDNVDFRYNTIDAAVQQADTIGAGGQRMVGNLITDVQGCRTGVTYMNNVWATGSCSSGTGNVTASTATIRAGFNGATGGIGGLQNYTLTGGSIALNKGSLAVAWPSTDFAGTVRYTGSAPEAGAYEYGG